MSSFSSTKGHADDPHEPTQQQVMDFGEGHFTLFNPAKGNVHDTAIYDKLEACLKNGGPIHTLLTVDDDKGELLWETARDLEKHPTLPGARVGRIKYHYDAVKDSVSIDYILIDQGKSYDVDEAMKALLSFFIKCIAEIHPVFYLESPYGLTSFFKQFGFIELDPSRAPSGLSEPGGPTDHSVVKLVSIPESRKIPDNTDFVSATEWGKATKEEKEKSDAYSKAVKLALVEVAKINVAWWEVGSKRSRVGGSARPRMRGDNAGAMSTRNQSKRKRRVRKRGTRKRGTRKRGTRKR